MIVGPGAAAALGAAARTCGYLLRERMRARAMARMARELSIRGGQAEVSDQDGTLWRVRMDPHQPQ
jgi:hypothetical protein